MCTAGILFYYSVYLVNKESQNKKEESDLDLEKKLGTFAIEDFDVAMKSKNPLKVFRKYIIDHPPNYSDVL